MKNEREIRWLQLSDLHMFDSTTMRRQKVKFYDILNELYSDFTENEKFHGRLFEAVKLL